MRYKADNVKINIDLLLKTKEREAIIKRIGLREESVKEFEILRKSLDCRYRDTKGIFYVYTVTFLYDKRINKKNVKPYKIKQINRINFNKNNDFTPVIVGAGPSGLMCGYYLLKMGYKPVILERGKDMRERVLDVKGFSDNGDLNPNSNVVFGLGGAGTFSDGKLNSRVKSDLKYEVFDIFIKMGAGKEIRYMAKPHLGTDKIREVISNLKEYMIDLGAVFHFDSTVTDFFIEDNKIKGVEVNGSEVINADTVILAIGSSARDTIYTLHKRKVNLENKPFAVGFRIEHLREEIDKCVYGSFYNHKLLKGGEYVLTYHDEKMNKGVYSFCQCPGGVVVASSSNKNQVVTNGMSFSKRNMINTNSAIVVNVNESDYGSEILSGVKFQEKIEKKAFEMGGGDFNAPCMDVYDFLEMKGKCSVKPSYKPGVKYVDIRNFYDEKISASIKNALKYFNECIPCFYNGVLTAVETRTSSPVRILRDKESYQSVNIKGLYPIGEGAGYAGGILTSAIDGIKIAMKLNEIRR